MRRVCAPISSVTPTMISTLPIKISRRASLEPVTAVLTGTGVVVVGAAVVVVVVVGAIVVVVDVDVVVVLEVVVVVLGPLVVVGDSGGLPESTFDVVVVEPGTVVSGDVVVVVDDDGGVAVVDVVVLDVVVLDVVVLDVVVVVLVLVVVVDVVDVVDVVELVVVDAGTVVVGTPSQMLDSTNLTLLSGAGGGLTSANEPDAVRSDAANPTGIGTNTLSRCPPFGVMSASEYVRSVPATMSVIEWNAYVPLFGAITKCQLGPMSVGHVPDSASSLCRSSTPNSSSTAVDRFVKPITSNAAPSSVSSAAQRTSRFGRSDASPRPSLILHPPAPAVVTAEGR